MHRRRQAFLRKHTALPSRRQCFPERSISRFQLLHGSHHRNGWRTGIQSQLCQQLLHRPGLPQALEPQRWSENLVFSCVFIVLHPSLETKARGVELFQGLAFGRAPQSLSKPGQQLLEVRKGCFILVKATLKEEIPRKSTQKASFACRSLMGYLPKRSKTSSRSSSCKASQLLPSRSSASLNIGTFEPHVERRRQGIFSSMTSPLEMLRPLIHPLGKLLVTRSDHWSLEHPPRGYC